MTSVATPLSRLQAADAQLCVQASLPLGLGDLAPIVVGAVSGLQAKDWWVPGPRERAGAVLRGVAVERLGDGLSGQRPYKIAPVSVAPAQRALHAVGLALASTESAVLVHLGSAAVADGAFAEALNLASLRGVRVIFLVSWRDLSGAPVPSQSQATPADLARAYGLATVTVAGTDAEAVAHAVTTARAAQGPTVIQAELPARPHHD